jgi:predicted extracellular nuclease
LLWDGPEFTPNFDVIALGASATTANTVITTTPGSPQLQYNPGRIDPTHSAWSSSRKPLAGEFLFQGHRFFVIANHFNSKGGDDPPYGHRQPPVLSSQAQRDQQAQLVHDFVAQNLDANPNADVLVMGALNDFEFSHPSPRCSERSCST